MAAFDENGKATNIGEKSKELNSNYVLTELYFYPVDVSARTNQMKLSVRRELEITSLNEMYFMDGYFECLKTVDTACHKVSL